MCRYHRSYHVIRGHMGGSEPRDSTTSDARKTLQFPKSCWAGRQVPGMTASWRASINEANKQRDCYSPATLLAALQKNESTPRRTVIQITMTPVDLSAAALQIHRNVSGRQTRSHGDVYHGCTSGQVGSWSQYFHRPTSYKFESEFLINRTEIVYLCQTIFFLCQLWG